MKKKDIMELTGAGDATISRWMREHPKLESGDPNSLLGHPFPTPTAKDGRAFVWDSDEVHAWWDANKKLVGRHTEETASFRMPAARFARFFVVATAPGASDDEKQHHESKRALETVRSIEPAGDEVTLTFSDVSDAIHFRLRFA